MRRPAKIATYYARLKVAQDAPPEVIRAAHKALAQKVHPDRHQGSVRHEVLLVALNKARDVLLDPARRAAHDRWIREEEIRLGWREPDLQPSLRQRCRLVRASVRLDGLSFGTACRLHLTRAQRWAVVGGVALLALGGIAGTCALLAPRPDPMQRLLGALRTQGEAGGSAVRAAAAGDPSELRPAGFPSPAPR
jgi:hypothetical protein